MNRETESQKRRFNRAIRGAMGICLAATVAASGFTFSTDAVYAAKQEQNEASADNQQAESKQGTAVYLNGASGSNDKDGKTSDTAVASFSRAKKLLPNGGTIFISGTITVSKSEKWSLSSKIKVKKADGFTKPIVEVKEGAVLTLSSKFIEESDMKLANADCLVIKGNTTSDKTEKPKDETAEKPKDETKQDDNKEQPKEPVKEEDKKPESEKKIQASDISIPKTLTMDTAQALSNLPLIDCKGDGVFYWEDKSFVPTAYESKCKVFFKPNNTDKYDYSAIAGWDEKNLVVKRTITVITNSLKEPEAQEQPAVPAEKPDQADDGHTTLPDAGNNQQQTETKDETQNAGNADNSTKPADQNPAEAVPPPTDSESPSENTQTPKETDEAKGSTDTPASDSKDLEVEAVNLAVSELVKTVTNASDVNTVVAASKLYEKLDEQQKAQISRENLDLLGSAQESCKKMNLTSNGITVSADFLPWYVQFRVSLKADSDLSQEPNVKTIFSSYDLKLWNLITDSEYEIPDGEKVKVSMKAPDMTLYDQCVIIHTLKSGEKEYITPKIEGGRLTFETKSFSPFDIAGTKPLVGSGANTGNAGDAAITGNTGISGSGSSNKSNISNSNTSQKSNTNQKSNTTTSKNTSTKTTQKTVKTGDDTQWVPYLIGGGIAFVLIILLLAMGKKKGKKKDN